MEGPGSVTLTELISWIRDGGVIALLTIIVWGSYKEWWVPGTTHRRALDERDLRERRILSERDELQRELFDVLGLADRATRVAERTVRRGAIQDDRIGHLEGQSALRDKRETNRDKQE